jgi:hypothetical protein
MSYLALVGALELLFSPFSFVPYLLRFSAASVIAGFLWAYKPVRTRFPAHPTHTVHGSSYAIPITSLLVALGAVMGYMTLTSLIAINDLSTEISANIPRILTRSASQFFSYTIFMIELICGFAMARAIAPERLRLILIVPLSITLALALYQVLAISFNLPYLGRYANDVLVGVRPSALAMEPKYLSSYLIIFSTFLLLEASTQKSIKRIVGYSAMALMAGYFFLAASSGNGMVTLLIIIITHTILRPTKTKILTWLAVIFFSVSIYSAVDFDDLPIRASHKTILESLSAIDILMFDDLIFLPALAWMDHPSMVVFGYGPGLMHFYGEKYAAYATWLTDATFIEGNLAAIMYISNLGAILFVAIIAFVVRQSKQQISRTRLIQGKNFDILFLHLFMSGAFVSGNISTPVFLACGWLLGRLKLESAIKFHEHKTTATVDRDPSIQR